MAIPAEQVAQVHIVSEPDDDAEYLDELTSLLREELLELDVTSVESITEDHPPGESKGGMAAVGGWLAVHLGPAALKALVSAVVSWVARTDRTIELVIDGDSVKVTRASEEVQNKLVELIVAKHSTTS